jgi:hypothetical protein
MPPITLSQISSANVKVRWKEPYASEGLNRKLAVVVPSGVYRGLKLGVSTTNLSVDLLADAAGDHVAVHENQLGFSTTYVDDTSGTITLPLTGFLTNDVVVVCLLVTYTSGSSTTALFRGYELSEYDALSASSKQDLVVLGTVLRPAAGIIPAANITHDRRKLPFLQRADEAVPWNPLIRNGGFELGQTNGTYRHASPFWKTSTTNANFTVRPVTTEFRSGAKSLEMTTGVAGIVVATIQQDLWMPVTPGRYIMGRLFKKVILAPSGAPPPTGRLRFLFGDLDGINDVQEDLLFDISAIDGSFEENTGIVKVPATARVLKAVQIILDATYAGTGPCIRLDDVQAWAQVDGANWLDVQDSRVRETAVGDMFLGAANSFGNNSAKLSFDGALINIDRRDGLQTLPPPALAINGRQYTSQRYTLLFQSAIPLPDPPYTGLTMYYRKYVSSFNFSVVETVNASFDNGTLNWSKDVTFAMLGSAIGATKHEISYRGVKVYGRSGSVADDAPWTETGWKEYVSTAVPEAATTVNSDTPSVDNLNFAPIVQVRDVSGRQRTVVDHNGFTISRVSEIRQEWLRNDGSAPEGWLQAPGLGGTINYDAAGHGLRLVVPSVLNAYAGIKTTRPDLVQEGSQYINVMEWDNSLSIAASFDQCNVFMGWGRAVVNGSADSFIHIGKDSAAANWKLYTHEYTGGPVNYISGATAVVDTGVAANALATRFRLEWHGSSAVGGARVLAYINGALKAQVLTAGSIPASSLGVALEIKRVSTSTGTDKNIQPGPIVLKHNRFQSDDAL